jgi:hypothetical protein
MVPTKARTSLKMRRPPAQIHPAAFMGGEGGLRNADGGANLEGRDVGENVVAVNHAPFVTAWRGAQMILVVIDFVAAIPVVLLDGRALVPFLVFDVSVIVVMVLGQGDAAHKACGKDCER